MPPFKRMVSQVLQLLAVGGLAAAMTCSAFANPIVDNVAAGQVSIQQSPGTTIVNQSSQQAIINWQSFNIGQGESTHFNQPAGGIALNRINPSQGASQIYGSLTATGQIILMNPAGFYFGPSAYVNVGGLMATTANMTDQHFLNGMYQFSKVDGYSGAIINEGQMIAAQNGLIALLAPGVINNGVIQANLGKVILASGDAFTVNFAGNDMISFAVDVATSARGIDKDGHALPAGISNTGNLIANGGSIMLSAKSAAGVLDNVINLQGVAQAKSVYQQNGQIIISGDPDAGVVNVAANIDVSGKNAGEAGGKVDITGYNILLDSPTLIDASGDIGGGSVNVGGSYQGKGPLANSNAVVMMPDAFIHADALTNGDGGNIVLWSDYATKAFGTLTAKGGALTGNGGVIETSGKIFLDVGNIQVSTLATNGVTGNWLLDPSDVTINNDATSNIDTVSSIFVPTADSSTLSAAALGTALNSSNITVATTNASGTQLGDIIFNDAANDLFTNWTTKNNTLTLQADNNIITNYSITLRENQSLSLLAGNTTASGGITINGNIRGIHTGDGAVYMRAGTAGVVTIATALGSIARLGTLTIDSNGISTTAINANVVTSGTQTYNTPVVLGANVTLVTMNNAVTFNSTINSNLTARSLSVFAGSGAITLADNVGAALNGALRTIILSSTGITTIGGTIAAAIFTKMGAGSTLLNGGTLTTTGAQSFAGPVRLGADTTLNTISGAVTLSSTLDRDATARAFTVNSVSGAITLAGDVGAGVNGALGALTLTSTGITTVDGTLAAASFTKAGAGSTLLNGGTLTTTGAQSFTGAVRLGADTTLNTTNGAVTLSSTLDRDATARAFTVNTGSGAITLTGDVGAGVNGALGALTLTSTGITTVDGTLAAASFTKAGAGSTLLNGGTLTTVGAQSFAGAVTLGADTTLNTTNSAVTFSSTLDRDVTAARALSINAGTGAITLAGNVGAGVNSALGAMTLASTGATTIGGTVNAASLLVSNGGQILLNGGSVTTSAGQTYSGAVTLGADTTLTAGDAVLFSSTIDRDVLAARSLAVVIGAGASDMTFTGNIGSGVNGALGAIFLNNMGTGATILTGNINAESLSSSSATTLNATTINTTGNISFSGALTLGAGAKIFTSSAGSILFNGAVDGSQSLTLNGSTGVTLSGAVGAITPLSDLTVTGLTNINSTITTAGIQTYHSPIQLGGDVVLTTTDSAVTLNSILDRDATARAFSVSTGTGGMTLAGNVGAGVNGALGAMTLISTGGTTIGGTVNAASLSISDVSGIFLNGGSVTTTAGQTYSAPVTLGADTTFTAGDAVIFSSSIDRDVLAARSLAVVIGAGASDMTFTGNIGSGVNGALRAISLNNMGAGATILTGNINAESLSSSSATTLNATTINTTGNISFSGALTLGAGASILTSTSGAIEFSDVVNVNHDLTASANAIRILNGLSGVSNLSVVGIGGNASLTVQGDGVQLFNIDSANAGSVEDIGSFSGQFAFSNINNLIGGVNGATFNFADNATIGSVAGNNLNAINTIDIVQFTKEMQIVLTDTNNGSVKDLLNTQIADYFNISQVNANAVYDNTLTVSPDKPADLYITDSKIGYVNDPLFFNGFNYFVGSTGSVVNFLTPYTFDSSTRIYTVNGTPMYISEFTLSVQPSPPMPASATVLDVIAAVNQQPLTNANQLNNSPASAALTASSAWVIDCGSANKNLTQFRSCDIHDFDITLHHEKVNPYFCSM